MAAPLANVPVHADLSTVTPTTPVNGDTYFPRQTIASGASVSATATDPAGNTSEFSAVRIASPPSTSGFFQIAAASDVVPESAGVATFTVTRNGGNSGPARVAYSTSDGTATAETDYGFTSGIFIFQDGEVGSKSFTIPILDDSRAEGSETLRLRLSNASGATLGPGSDSTLTITDDDIAGVTVTPTSGLVTTEAGAAATFTVRLNTQPNSDVIIGLASNNPNEGTVSTASLVFNAANWNIPQIATVTGVDDNVVDGDVNDAIVTSAASSADPFYNALAVPDVAVTNRDDDVAGITVTPTSGPLTTESGGTASFTVRLNTRPIASVTIALDSTNPAEGLADRASVVFDPTNWNIPQVVTVRGINDDADDGDLAYSIATAPATGGDPRYNGLDAPDVGLTNLDDDVAVIITDRDVAGVTIAPLDNLVTTEFGGTATFTARLNSRPSADVTIGFRSGNAAEGSVNTPSLTFTPANWNIPRSVIVTGVDDTVADGAVGYTISVTPTVSADPFYNGLQASNISVTNADDDAAGFTLSAIGGLVTSESGGSSTFSLRLNSRPSGLVEIPIASSNAAESVATPSSLIFTPENWGLPQVVTIVGVDDTVNDGDIGYAIITGNAVSADPSYGGLSVPDVGVSNANDDTAGIGVPPPSGVAAVTVVNVQVANVKVGRSRSKAIVISLSDGLSPSTVPNLASYRLVAAGRDKRYGTKDDVVTILRSATYDPAARTITLRPRKKSALSTPAPLQLTIASGVLDRLNRSLDGNRDGRPGGDAIATIRRSRVTIQSVAASSHPSTLSTNWFAAGPRHWVPRKRV